jgi:ribonuclease HI
METAYGTLRLHIPKGNTVASSNVDHPTGTVLWAERSRIPKVIEIYTDGSHDKTGTGGYLGFGAFCKYNSVEYRLSAECTNKLLSIFGIGSYRDKISNPTAEFIAFAFVLNKLKDLRNIYTFKFHIDYVGVINWMNGTWKAREPYIIAIKEYCDKIITGHGLHIQYIHVKGHSGVYGNEEADKLASSKENKDEFNKLVDVLSLDDNL